MYANHGKPVSTEMITFIVVVSLFVLALIYVLWRRYRQAKRPVTEQQQRLQQRRRLSLDTSVMVFAPQQFKP